MNGTLLRPFCVLIGLLFSGTIATESAWANLVLNGGFENGVVAGSPTGHGDVPTPWTSSAPLNFLISYYYSAKLVLLAGRILWNLSGVLGPRRSWHGCRSDSWLEADVDALSQTV